MRRSVAEVLRMESYLDELADRMEGVLGCRITGGRLLGPNARFRLGEGADLERVRPLCERLAEIARASWCRVEAGDEGVVLVMPNPAPLLLRDLLGDGLEPLTLALGVTGDGVPVYARLVSNSDVVNPVLIVGEHGAGKTSLLRTIALSVAFTSSVAKFLCLGWEPPEELPLVREATFDPVVVDEILRSLGRLLNARQREMVNTPLVVMIDDLSVVSPAAKAVLLRVMDATGVYLVLTVTDPLQSVLTDLLPRFNARPRFGLRLVGRLGSSAAESVAAGRVVGAGSLNGRGDFVAVAEGYEPLRFQAAYEPLPGDQLPVSLWRREIA